MRSIAALLGVGLLLLVGCGSSGTTKGPGEVAGSGVCDPGPIDSTPGGSTEFEPADIEAAKNADCLVVVYCDGVDSEAQRVGCLSHVSQGDVCAQDTEGRQFAVETYIKETGDEAICE